VIFGGRRHFRDLLANSDEGIASNILSSRLKALVAGGLLSHEKAGRGRRGSYSLTEAGIQTVPIGGARFLRAAAPRDDLTEPSGLVELVGDTAVLDLRVGPVRRLEQGQEFDRGDAGGQFPRSSCRAEGRLPARTVALLLNLHP
jgi:hypothetical protein